MKLIGLICLITLYEPAKQLASFLLSPEAKRKMLSGQPCIITNNKITITKVLVGLVSHSIIGNLQLLTNLLYYLLHRSNAINSSLHLRISHIMNSNLQKKIWFMTKNYKGRRLF